MKRIIMAILGILIVVLAIGAAVAIFHGRSNNNTGNGYGNTTTQSSTTPTPTPSPTASSAGKVTIANMAFTPPQITVHKGDTVTWTNNDGVAHTVVDDLSNVGGPSSGNINPGASYSFTFTKTGSFQYHCSIHPSMRGTIVVQ